MRKVRHSGFEDLNAHGGEARTLPVSNYDGLTHRPLEPLAAKSDLHGHFPQVHHQTVGAVVICQRDETLRVLGAFHELLGARSPPMVF